MLQSGTDPHILVKGSRIPLGQTRARNDLASFVARALVGHTEASSSIERATSCITLVSQRQTFHTLLEAGRTSVASPRMLTRVLPVCYGLFTRCVF